jgi:hypothetical protein
MVREGSERKRGGGEKGSGGANGERERNTPAAVGRCDGRASELGKGREEWRRDRSVRDPFGVKWETRNLYY